MSPRRFLVPGPIAGQGLLELPPDEASHASKVLRLERGAEIQLIDGEGNFARALVEEIGKRRVICRILELGRAESLRPELTICPGILKGQAMDLVVVKLTELAVDHVRPFDSVRAVGKVKDKADRMERWEKLSGQALKQCGAARRPVFHPPLPLAELLIQAPADALRLMLYEQERTLGLAQALSEARTDQAVWVLIGPEGGFTPEEVELAVKHGFTICGLPGTILRAETANIAAAAVIRFGVSSDKA